VGELKTKEEVSDGLFFLAIRPSKSPPPPLPPFYRNTEVPNKPPLTPDSPRIKFFGQFSVIAQVKHENLGQVFARRGSCIRCHMPVWIVFGFYIRIVMSPKGSFEGHTAEQASMGMSKSMTVFMAEDIA
jgi:hypothetical protein